MFTGLSEYQPLEQELRRICKKAPYVEFIGETRVTIPLREISDFASRARKGRLGRRRSARTRFRSLDAPTIKSTFEHHPREDKGDSVTGNEDEEIRRIAKAEFPRCHPVHDVVGDMVQEDSPICHTSE